MCSVLLTIVFFVPLLFVIFEIVLGFTTSHYPFGILLPICPEHLNTLPVRPEHLKALAVRVAQYFCVVLSLVSYQTLPIRPEHLNALPVRVAQYLVMLGLFFIYIIPYGVQQSGSH
jgi:hypothetical protein